MAEASCGFSADQEPSYNGRPLSNWVSQFLATNAPSGWAHREQQTIAADAVRHMGTNATPFLVHWVEQTNLLGVAAGKALISLGPDASPAFPALRRFLNGTNIFNLPTRALWILREIGGPATAVLADAAADKHNHMREPILSNLRYLGPRAIEARPALTRMLSDPEASALQWLVAEALQAIAGEPIAN
jgi:hypothetical protein